MNGLLRKVGIGASLVVLSVGKVSGGSGSDPWGFTSAVLDGIAAEIVECPATTVNHARERVCAKYSPSLYDFRREWNRLLAEEADLAAMADAQGDWTTAWGSCCYRDYSVSGSGFRVTLDFRAKLATIVYGSGASETDEPGEIPVAGTGGVSEPVVVSSKKPKCPKRAKKQRIAGMVLLRVVVRQDGTVDDPQLVWACPMGYGMEEAAVECVKQWRFEPAVRDGDPVDAYHTVVVPFGVKIGRGKAEPLIRPGSAPVLAPGVRP